LALQKGLQSTQGLKKYVRFTNFENSNRVNKRASQVFYGEPNGIPPEGPLVFRQRPNSTNIVELTTSDLERSFRNVYDALERDFESLEQAEEEAER
jgi:hypothetical protein